MEIHGTAKEKHNVECAGTGMKHTSIPKLAHPLKGFRAFGSKLAKDKGAFNVCKTALHTGSSSKSRTGKLFISLYYLEAFGHSLAE